ncbi:MAG: hypothetical protein ACOCXA_00550 [Planctomycetota bacterium]
MAATVAQVLTDLRACDNPHVMVTGRHALSLALVLLEHLVASSGYRCLLLCHRQPSSLLPHPVLPLRDCAIDLGAGLPEESLAFLWDLLCAQDGDRDRQLRIRQVLDGIIVLMQQQSQAGGRWLRVLLPGDVQLDRWEYLLGLLAEQAREQRVPQPRVLDSDGNEYSIAAAMGRLLAGCPVVEFRRLRLFMSRLEDAAWYDALGLEPELEELWLQTLAGGIASELRRQPEFAAAELSVLLDYARVLAGERRWQAAWMHATDGMVSATATAKPLASSTIVSALESAGFSEDSALLARLTVGERPWPLWQDDEPLRVITQAGAEDEFSAWKAALGLLACRQAAQVPAVLDRPKAVVVDARLAHWPMVAEQLKQLLRTGRKYGLTVVVAATERAQLTAMEPLADLVVASGPAIQAYDPGLAIDDPLACHVHHMLEERSEPLVDGFDHRRFQEVQQLIA